MIWAFFAAAIAAIPISVWLDSFRITLILIGIVSAECLVLALNGIKCPLTQISARYTDSREDNFDICLPLWLARYNKEVFGTLFALGIILAVARWLY